MRSWLLLGCTLGLVAGACYHPADVAHCAITCDPLVGNCPGSLICGTDSFCHSLDEPLNGCLANTTDATPRPDAQIFPHDGPPDSPHLAIDAPSCASEWRADFSSDPTLGTGPHWVSTGTVPFSFSSQVSFGTWNAPDQSGLATAPGFDLQGETLITADLDLPQVGQTAGFTIGLTDGARFAQLSLVLGHPTAGTDSISLANNFGGAQPEMLLSQSAPIGKHHLHLDVSWPTTTVALMVDGAAAAPAMFMTGIGSSIAATVAVGITTGANIDNLDVCAL